MKSETSTSEGEGSGNPTLLVHPMKEKVRKFTLSEETQVKIFSSGFSISCRKDSPLKVRVVISGGTLVDPFT